MKQLIEIENDLAVPLKESDVEWNLYLYKKRYKQKVIDSYDTYKINSIPLATAYSDIHKYTVNNILNKLEMCSYSSEIPKNKIGFIDLTTSNNILKNSLKLIDEGIDNNVLFASQDLALHGYILECKINSQVYMRIFSTCKPVRVYQHKYSVLFKTQFNELSDPILTINHSCDCIVFNDYCLFLSGKAESIFDLEKHYKALSTKCLNSLQAMHLFDDSFENFYNYASVWPKAAKFETFDIERINEFCKLDTSKKCNILQSFSIPLNEHRINYKQLFK